ncbi:MAG TPA: hypothetical protein VNU95_03700 [Candidatus Acidoferrales bacterium]|jgi:hypothetical protein|nr:hypothetical protein [Candidatus Acidoferrales bacterium]
MDSDGTTIDAKEAFYWKMASYSLIATFGNILFLLLSFVILSHVLSTAPFNQTQRCDVTLAFIVQIMGLVTGAIGLFGPKAPIKLTATLGIILSCAIGLPSCFLFS